MTEIDKISNKICYVTLNKPYNTILMNIKSLNIDANKFFFVDAISATVQTPEGVDNCSFVSSPTVLTDLSLAFSEALSNKECDNAVFDTISTLVVYQDINSVIKFVHNLITKIRVLNKKSIFVALKEDSEELIKDLNMFVDNVVEMNS
ncbi:hypothetical protein JXB41_03810 [Candidatus Woesearchaeota archaeon]|nr:hypothetical protein [Candidatus Woesearchaeota archaeon]